MRIFLLQKQERRDFFMETIKHHKIFATHISVYFVDGICVAAAAIVCGSFFFACAVIEMFSLQILSEAYIIHVHIFTAYAYVNMRHSFTLRKFPTKSFIHKQLLPRISEARVTKFTECDCEYWKITCHHLAESYALCSLSRVYVEMEFVRALCANLHFVCATREERDRESERCENRIELCPMAKDDTHTQNWQKRKICWGRKSGSSRTEFGMCVLVA